jgi:hypothetical protein
MGCGTGGDCSPCDSKTRKARNHAHKVFDQHWKSGIMERSDCYRLLAKHLGIAAAKAHIGLFDYSQCQKVIAFAKTLSAKKAAPSETFERHILKDKFRKRREVNSKIKARESRDA